MRVHPSRGHRINEHTQGNRKTTLTTRRGLFKSRRQTLTVAYWVLELDSEASKNWPVAAQKFTLFWGQRKFQNT